MQKCIILAIMLIFTGCSNLSVDNPETIVEQAEQFNEETNLEIINQLNSPPSMYISYENQIYHTGMGTYSWTTNLGNDRFQSVEADSEGPIEMTKDSRYTFQINESRVIQLVFDEEPLRSEVNLIHDYSHIEVIELNKDMSFTIPKDLTSMVYEFHVTYDQGDVYYAIRIEQTIEQTLEQTLEEMNAKLSNYTWINKEFNKVDPTTKVFGVIITPLIDFNIKPDISMADYLKLFKKDNKYGYKNSKGEVIVSPIYDYAYEFWRGIASVREDQPNGGYKWSTIDFNGKLMPYDEVDGFTYGVSSVKKDNKYGFINSDGQLLTPIVFDELYLSHAWEKTVATVRIGERYLFVDLGEGNVYEYEPYNYEHMNQYDDTINLTEENIMIVNNRIVIDGKTDDRGITFPALILDQLNYVVYKDNKVSSNQIGHISQGDFEGDLNIRFDSIKPYYYAFIGETISNDFVYETLDNHERYDKIVQSYISSQGIEYAPISISRILRGDFMGNNKNSLLIEAHDGYQSEIMSMPLKEEWTEAKFKEDKTGFFNVIILIEDETDVADYIILKANYFQEADELGFPTFTIMDVGNMDQDDDIEIILENSYYEYGDYSLLELKTPN